LADIPPHLFFECIAVDTFNGRIIVRKDIADWCIEVIVSRPNNKGVFATLPTLRLPRQQLIGVNRKSIGKHIG
jgi:hypothetical protein